MSASQPSGNWQRGESVCVCACARKEGLFISNPVFLFPLRSDSHNNTQLCEFMLCPFPLSFSVSVFLYHSPFLSPFPSKKWISPLYTPLSNYFGEEGGKKEGEGLHTKRGWKKNTPHSCTALHKRNKETGAGEARWSIKKDSFQQERQRRGLWIN